MLIRNFFNLGLKLIFSVFYLIIEFDIFLLIVSFDLNHFLSYNAMLLFVSGEYIAILFNLF